jgi:hypothetical protein
MSSKKFLKIVLGLSFFVAILIGGVNYIVDPYGMNNFINIDKFNSKKYSNTKYTIKFKSNILRSNQFDTIMLGTSRIGVMNPNVVDKYLKSNTFNLEIPGSITLIQNKFFKYANHFNDIKYLIYGIDFMSFNSNRTIEKTFTDF